MADPVTLAVIGATAGAALNPDDPLKGAVVGGTLGFGGASLAGLGAAGGTAAAGTTVGAGGIGGAAGGTGLTAATTGSAIPGSALGAASGGMGLTAGANTAMAASAPLSAAGAAAPGMGVGGGLAALANPSMSAAAPFAMSTAAPTMISAPMQAPTMGQMNVANQLMARGQPQQQSEVRQGGMMRPGQAVNVTQPVASLLEPLKNRRPRPAFSLL